MREDIKRLTKEEELEHLVQADFELKELKVVRIRQQRRLHERQVRRELRLREWDEQKLQEQKSQEAAKEWEVEERRELEQKRHDLEQDEMKFKKRAQDEWLRMPQESARDREQSARVELGWSGKGPERKEQEDDENRSTVELERRGLERERVDLKRKQHRLEQDEHNWAHEVDWTGSLEKPDEGPANDDVNRRLVWNTARDRQLERDRPKIQLEQYRKKTERHRREMEHHQEHMEFYLEMVERCKEMQRRSLGEA
ncbi:hypothetical protein EJ06DRAFT_560294 [Trichodelitschia bisporula]|uniref:Uncharacterized protein n=1 Tax=Trichodelitschia bisporula TaxID=703511 RepID=A0A6G1HJ27_9PEZI|nr:hypothetical protein EJ06DRAFT_560294 [Trichodelitschia bisporula]